MKILNKKIKAADSLTSFEKEFIQKEKVNPVVKAGSIVLYATVIIAVLACILMAVLDKSGVAPSPLSDKDKTADKAKVVDVSSHPESLQRLYNENFETADFVASYFDEKDKVKEVSLKKYQRTKDIPLFVQWDKQWGYVQYGDDILGVNGDAPVCLAMVGYYLTGDASFSPDKVASFAVENGFYKKGKGTSSSIMKEGAEKLGLTSSALEVKKENIVSAMNEGKIVICLIDKGLISTSEHYIVLRAYEDDKLFINDPTSIVNSEKEWICDDIVSAVKKAWVITK